MASLAAWGLTTLPIVSRMIETRTLGAISTSTSSDPSLTRCTVPTIAAAEFRDQLLHLLLPGLLRADEHEIEHAEDEQERKELGGGGQHPGGVLGIGGGYQHRCVLACRWGGGTIVWRPAPSSRVWTR